MFVVDCTDMTQSSYWTSPAKCIFNYRDGRTREVGFLLHLMVRMADGHVVSGLLGVAFFLPDGVQSYSSCTIFQLSSQHKMIDCFGFFCNAHHSRMWVLHWQCFLSRLCGEDSSIILISLQEKGDVGSFTQKHPLVLIAVF